MNIVEAIKNDKLFKLYFRDLSTWAAWLVLLKGLFGLSMTRKELKLYRKCTARKKAPEKPFKELWAVVGRRGGKTYMMSIIAVFLALFYNFKQYLTVGERGVIQIIASDRAQARVAFRYISGILHNNPVFEQYIENETKETIELSTGIDIEVMTCSFRSIRGRTAVCIIADEIAFWMDSGANPDHEILAAVRPSMATIPISMLLVLSSPYARAGILFETYRDYFGTDDADILVWQAETRQMNPSISQTFIDREIEKDPSSATSEWGAVFRKDIETFLRLEALEKVVILGRYELPPSGFQYKAFTDPSGGSQDAFALAIAHREDSLIVLDVLRSHKPPFNTGEVVKDFAAILKEYNIDKVTGDRYGGEWPAQEFQKHNILYEQAPLTKSNLYLELEPQINTGTVELLDSKQLFTELRGLERRTGRAGKDSVDHGPRGHDDNANVLAGVCFILAEGKKQQPLPGPSFGYYEGDEIPTMDEILGLDIPVEDRWIND